MSLLSSLHAGSNVAVIGASGGIGHAFVDLLSADERVDSVHAFCRSSADWQANKVRAHSIDLTDEESIEAASKVATSDSPLDLVILASGVLHRDGQIQPEKSMRDISPKALAEVLEVNAVGPAVVTKHFLPKLRRKHKTVFAALSARVGSIGDNRLGGWVAYRMSKAALNMLVRTMAIEQARVQPESVLVALHPGTVQTRLSEPFTKRATPAQLFSPAEAASKLLCVVDDLGPEQSGGFFAYDGSRVEY